MKNCDEQKLQSKKRGVGARMLGIRNVWRNMFCRKKEKTKDLEDIISEDHLCLTQQSQKVNSFTNGNDVDIMDKDKDRIRTSCKLSLQDIPEFPSKEEVKKTIEEAHKYYGIKCVYNYHVGEGNSDEKQEPLPSWYYILERPLVEQYVLMNNYIKKLSVTASVKSQAEDNEETLDDNEEVSSISSQSDYSDFPTDSDLVGIYKKSKKERIARENDYRRNMPATDKYCGTKEYKESNKVDTIKTKDYDIVIRGPKNFFETESNTAEDSKNAENAPESSTRGRDHDDDGESSNEQLDEMRDTALSSGDHLPDMKDFDLSYNLSECTTIKPPLPGQSYYHWRGNSCPTKTPLLSTDTRPARQRGPHSSMDFWSFRNFSLSTEFIEMCDNCENKTKVKESQMNATEYGNFSQKASNSNNAAVKTPNQKDENTMNLDKLQKPTTSNNNEEGKFDLPSISQIKVIDDREESTSCSRTSSTASVITKLPTDAGKKNLNN